MKLSEDITNNLILLIFIIIIILFALLYNNEREKFKKAEKSLAHYNELFKSRQGGTSLYNGKILNYNLKTFDGGKIWYACEYGDNWELKILGEAENVYPGLINSLDAWENLTKYVKENGPIGSTPITPELKKIMDDANLKITTKENGNN